MSIKQLAKAALHHQAMVLCGFLTLKPLASSMGLRTTVFWCPR